MKLSDLNNAPREHYQLNGHKKHRHHHHPHHSHSPALFKPADAHHDVIQEVNVKIEKEDDCFATCMAGFGACIGAGAKHAK